MVKLIMSPLIRGITANILIIVFSNFQEYNFLIK